MQKVWMVFLLLVAVGCQTLPPPAVQPDWRAEAEAQHQAYRQQVEAELAVLRAQPKAAPTYPDVPYVPPDDPPPKNPAAVIKQANAKALVHPRPEWFARNTLFLPYLPGATYDLPMSTSQPTTFYFPPGEILRSYMGLEGSKRWTHTLEDLDDGGVKSSTLTVVPNEEDLVAGVTLATTRRIYVVRLKSQAGPGVIGVRWRYPEETVAQAAKSTLPPASEIWHVGYTITVTQGSPTWVPERAYDTGLTGKKTVVEFGPGLAVTSLPEIYAPNATGELEQVNGRLLDQRYVIDLVAPRFELRLGVGDAAEVVVIQRDREAYRAVRCPGEDCPRKGAI